MRLTNTVARVGLTASVGISESGGHQHVKFLIRMGYGTGVLPHACTE